MKFSGSSSPDSGTNFAFNSQFSALRALERVWQIRSARLPDLSALSAILLEGFHPSTSWQWLQPFVRLGIQEDLRQRLSHESSHYVCLIASSQTEEHTHQGADLVGTVEISLRSPDVWLRGTQPYPYLSNLTVRAAWRGQGVAQQLLVASEHVALSWGFQDLYLHVLEQNYPARNLYQKAGYRLQQSDAFWYRWLPWRSPRLLLHKHLLSPLG
jgi:GNAT superfamily N-acetyltransferase